MSSLANTFLSLPVAFQYPDTVALFVLDPLGYFLSEKLKKKHCCPLLLLLLLLMLLLMLLLLMLLLL